jgi:membrane-associated phospholipid phosphatase
MVRVRSALAIAGAVSLLSGSAVAGDRDVVWDPAWRRFQWWEYAGTTAAIGGSIALAFGAAYPDDGYRHGVLLDDPVRDLFLLRDRQGRDKAKILGNMLYIWSLIHPYLVDVVAVTWIGHGSGDVAWQMFLINLESHAVAGLLSLLADHHIGRARPSVEACERDPRHELFCDGADRYASFPSGHTAIAATTAGLVCVHHSKLPLYGDTPFGRIECVASIGAAVTVGTMRILNDRHWSSDVVTGYAVGALAGYVLPMSLHYGWSSGPIAPEPRPLGSPRATLVPLASPSALGLAWVGIF